MLYMLNCVLLVSFSDPALSADMKHWPFKVVEKDGKPVVQVRFPSFPFWC